MTVATTTHVCKCVCVFIFLTKRYQFENNILLSCRDFVYVDVVQVYYSIIQWVNKSFPTPSTPPFHRLWLPPLLQTTFLWGQMFPVYCTLISRTEKVFCVEAKQLFLLFVKMSFRHNRSNIIEMNWSIINAQFCQIVEEQETGGKGRRWKVTFKLSGLTFSLTPLRWHFQLDFGVADIGNLISIFISLKRHEKQQICKNWQQLPNEFRSDWNAQKILQLQTMITNCF